MEQSEQDLRNRISVLRKRLADIISDCSWGRDAYDCGMTHVAKNVRADLLRILQGKDVKP